MMPKCELSVLALTIMMLTATAHSQSNMDRYNDLKGVPELINDPDPLMRIVNFEQIMKEGDQLKMQMAIQIALGIDDQRLRAVAAKAYLMKVREVSFEWQLPEEVAGKVKTSPEKLSRNETGLHKAYSSRAGLIPIRLSEIGIGGKFQVDAYGAIHEASEGRILGDRFIFRSLTIMDRRYYCTFDFSPTPTLRLEGTLRCEAFYWGRPMQISAEMF